MRRIYAITISSILVTFLIPSLNFSEPGIKAERIEVARDGRFRAFDDGTVKDTWSGLMWAAMDNGEGIKWPDAKKYCENYRGGGYRNWRLPTVVELQTLYDGNKSYRVNRRGYTVHLTGLIQISTCYIWSSEIRGSQAAYVFFVYGYNSWSHQYHSNDGRALPVRDAD